MAKQSGLHQIRGKVGEHSYYKQTGVSAGLIRSINQGLSSRVKTGAEYVNTRLNMAEFGQACKIAGVLGQMITPKYRPMILPFSQSKMATYILEAIKSASGNWGERNLTSSDVQTLVGALNLVEKNEFSSYGVSVVNDGDGTRVIEVDEVLAPAKLSALGADGYNIRLIHACPWIGTYMQGDGKYALSFPRVLIEEFTDVVPGDSNDYTSDFRSEPPAGWPAFQLNFYICVVMPYREINGVKHILQEACTFLAQDTAPTEDPRE